MRERAEPGIIPLRRWCGGCRSLLPWARLAQVFPPITQAERRRNEFFISLPFGTARVSPKAIMYGSASHKINSANYRKTRKFTAPLI